MYLFYPDIQINFLDLILMFSRHNEMLHLCVVHQHCNDLRIGRGAIPQGSVWRGRKDVWFLASFAARGSGGCSCSFTHFIFEFSPLLTTQK